MSLHSSFDIVNLVVVLLLRPLQKYSKSVSVESQQIAVYFFHNNILNCSCGHGFVAFHDIAGNFIQIPSLQPQLQPTLQKLDLQPKLCQTIF